MTVFESFRAGRAEKARIMSPVRRSVVLKLAKLVGRKLPNWKSVRTNVLALSGFGFLDYAAYEFNHLIGFVAIGISLFLIEMLGGEK